MIEAVSALRNPVAFEEDLAESTLGLVFDRGNCEAKNLPGREPSTSALSQTRDHFVWVRTPGAS